MTPDEYVEKLAAEAYKREGDREESVIRGLPFFAAALGVLVAALGVARPSIAKFFAAYPLVTFLLLAGVTLSVLWVLWRLVQAAILPRVYTYIMGEDEMAAYAEQLKTYYQGQGLAGAALDDAVVRDLRAALVRQYTTAVPTNRCANNTRLKAQNLALAGLVAALAFAFALVVAIFVYSTVGDEDGAPDRGGTSGQRAGGGPAAGKGPRGQEAGGGTAPAAAHADDHQEGLGVGSENTREAAPAGEAVTGKPGTPEK